MMTNAPFLRRLAAALLAVASMTMPPTAAQDAPPPKETAPVDVGGPDGGAPRRPAQTPDLPLQGRTRQVRFDGSDIELLTPVAQPGKAFATVIELPEDGLKTILVHSNEDRISLEHEADKLFLKLLAPVEGYLDVVGRSGRLYRILFKPVTGGIFDSRLRVTAAEPAAKPAERSSSPPLFRRTPPALELIRAMRLSRPLEGYQVQQVNIILARSAGVEARAIYRYAASETLCGYIVRLSNHGTEQLRVDPSRFAGPDLVACAAREFVVAPGRHTFLYFVLVSGS